MQNIKKYIRENPERAEAMIRIAGTSTLAFLLIKTILEKRKTEATLGAASFVIRDLGGDPIPMIVNKLIEYSNKK